MSKAYVLGIAICSVIVLMISCDEGQNLGYWSVAIEEIDDASYPDNPEIPLRHPAFGQLDVDSFQLLYNYNDPMGRWTIRLTDAEADPCVIEVDSVHLFDWIPTVPEHIQKDKSLTRIGLQNQEFNRQQVIFYKEDFTVRHSPVEVSRVDIARNCLNSYLWEVILFAKHEGFDKVVYHGWFDFNQELYRDMFEQRNELSFETYRGFLEDWTGLEGTNVDLSVMRTAEMTRRVPITVRHQDLYPIVGERAKKQQNIITPVAFRSIEDFLNDSTRFATFSAPGLYSKEAPQATQLEKISKPFEAYYREVLVPGSPDKLAEIEVVYRGEDEESLRLIIGGFDLRWIPTLPSSHAHNGFQMPMGIANHSFYEPYVVARQQSSKHNTYYAIMMDSENGFLDNHKIGIDGPLLHFDQDQRNLLHVWLLAFERHAFVGHYVIEL